ASAVGLQGGGLAYEKSRDGVTADSILPSFSMSKSFASTIVGQLVDAGKLALDDPAPIPEWSGPRDFRPGLTPRNILNMSSGLQWTEVYEDPQSDVVKMVVRSRSGD